MYLDYFPLLLDYLNAKCVNEDNRKETSIALSTVYWWFSPFLISVMDINAEKHWSNLEDKDMYC